MSLRTHAFIVSLTASLVALSACVVASKPNPSTGAAGSGGSAGVLGGSGGAGATAGAGTSGSAATSGSNANPCLSSGDCGPPLPYCFNRTCVECTTNANCIGSDGRNCDMRRHACVQCLAEAQCGGLTPYCSPDGFCVQCLTPKNCGTGNVTCDTSTYRCQTTCFATADCANDPGRPYCDTDISQCVECLVNIDCPAIKPHCDPLQHVCAVCLAEADCTDPALPHCDSARTETCVACLVNADCTIGQICTANTCVANPN